MKIPGVLREYVSAGEVPPASMRVASALARDGRKDRACCESVLRSTSSSAILSATGTGSTTATPSVALSSRPYPARPAQPRTSTSAPSSCTAARPTSRMRDLRPRRIAVHLQHPHLERSDRREPAAEAQAAARAQSSPARARRRAVSTVNRWPSIAATWSADSSIPTTGIVTSFACRLEAGIREARDHNRVAPVRAPPLPRGDRVRDGARFIERRLDRARTIVGIHDRAARWRVAFAASSSRRR